MKYAEIEASADAFREMERVEQEESNRLLNKKRAEEEAEKEAYRDYANYQAHTILDEDLHVKEALQAIRDEIWKEGKIEWTERNSEQKRGWSLISDPYPVVALNSYHPTLTANIKLGSTTLDILIGTRETVKIEAFVTSVKKYGSRRLDQEVKKHGLSDGLWGAATATWWQYKPDLSEFNSEDVNAIRLFHYNLDIYRKFAEDHQGFPKQIRQWREKILDQLPPELREQGHLDSDQLREWGYKAKGICLPLKLFDRAITSFVPNLSVLY